MSDNNRPDFEKIKSSISIPQALEFYTVTLKKSGTRLVGVCPIHGGTNPRGFSVSTDSQVWYCFGKCGRGGSVLDLVAALEDCSILEAAKILEDRFGLA